MAPDCGQEGTGPEVVQLEDTRGWRTPCTTCFDWGKASLDTSKRVNIHVALPEDLGLTPLNCGRCGARAIGGHPCETCGFDPAGGDGEIRPY